MAYIKTSIAPPPPATPSQRIGMPAATSIAAMVKEMTSAVPRSGCEAMSSTAPPATSASGPRLRGWRSSLGRSASSLAA